MRVRRARRPAAVRPPRQSGGTGGGQLSPADRPSDPGLTQLDPDQLAAATAPLGPVCILAGAGTGKTRTIIHRINHLIQQGQTTPHKVLAVTFTNRAAGEMRARLDQMGSPGVQARTFHSAAMRQLRYFWPQVYGDLPWRLLDNKFRIVGRATRAAGLDSATETVRDVLSEIEWAKATLIRPDDYATSLAAHRRTPPVDAEKVARAYAAYEAAKRGPDGMLLDFDDLLLHTAAALENSPAVAEEFRAQYRTFVVDEYQDVTPLQQRVLDSWLGERDDITVVGDANQTIYSFTGATPRFLMDFSRRYPDATVVRLQRDYRSTPQVVGLANEIIGKARGRIAGSRLQLAGQRPRGPEPAVTGHPDETREARVVARRIRRLIDGGVPAREIAVLYRINAHSAVFEQALTEAGIAYRLRDGEGFYQRPEVRGAISAIIRAARSGRLDDGAGLADAVRALLVSLGLTEEEPEGAQARERWQSLGALMDLVEEILHASPGLPVEGLLGQLRTRQETGHAPAEDGVALATIHAAKGLEWDAVFLVGLVDGTLPIQHALRRGPDSEDVEEERRLLYVGVTRARTHLELSWAAARREGGRQSRKRSRFLDGIADDTPAPAAPKPSRRTAVCSTCGGQLATPTERIVGRCADCPSDVDPALVDALRGWRAETAKEMQVPAYVIFSDATLAGIAERRPRDAVGLMQVPGIGQVKADRYGPQVLGIVAGF